jgi:hypothetical protein
MTKGRHRADSTRPIPGLPEAKSQHRDSGGLHKRTDFILGETLVRVIIWFAFVRFGSMTAREELFYLRISVARIAQAAGIETEDLPVLGKGTRAIARLAAQQQRGWNGLAAEVAEYLKTRIVINRHDAKVLAKALRQYDTSDFASALILKLLGR